MKIDMSPEAVRARLRTMDDLWLLSVKLMNSKKADRADREDSEAVVKKAQPSLSEPASKAGS